MQCSMPLLYRKDFMYAMQIDVTHTFLLHIICVLCTLDNFSAISTGRIFRTLCKISPLSYRKDCVHPAYNLLLCLLADISIQLKTLIMYRPSFKQFRSCLLSFSHCVLKHFCEIANHTSYGNTFNALLLNL